MQCPEAEEAMAEGLGDAGWNRGTYEEDCGEDVEGARERERAKSCGKSKVEREV